MRVLIFAGSNYSQYSQGLIECSILAGHEVVGVVIKRAFTWRRIKEVFAGGGIGIKATFRKLASIIGLAAVRRSGWSCMLDKYNFKPSKISNLCNKRRIDFLLVDDINSEECFIFIDQLNADVALFGGGGIVRGELLGRLPIINCHMGLLPEYRGSYPWVWAVLNNDLDKIGVTAHMMGVEIDRGYILKVQLIKVDDFDDIEDVELHLEYIMVEVMLEALSEYEKRGGESVIFFDGVQFEGMGQYYMPHYSLYDLAKNLFKSRKRVDTL